MKKYIVKLLKKVCSVNKKDKHAKFINPPFLIDNVTFFDGVLEGLLAIKKPINIVQVGANDGLSFDPIHKFVTANNSMINILYIEPQVDVFDLLKDNHKSNPNAKFLNAAIGPAGHLTMYRLKRKYWGYYKRGAGLDSHCWATAVASSNYDHVLSRVKKYLKTKQKITDYDAVIEKLVVPSYDLAGALQNSGFKEQIDLLLIDTEGFDDHVIYASNIPRFLPPVICYEYVHIDIQRHNKLKKYLNDLGYKTVTWRRTDEVALLTKQHFCL